MLFCSSMVKVVIIVLLCGATLCAVTTFITPFGNTSKRILKRIDVGEGTAMGGDVTIGRYLGIDTAWACLNGSTGAPEGATWVPRGATPGFVIGSKWQPMAGSSEKFGRKKEDAIAALLTQRNTEE